MLPTVTVPCPHCGERIELMIDASTEVQRYTEDCPVCCRPIEVSVALDGAGEVLVNTSRDNGA